MNMIKPGINIIGNIVAGRLNFILYGIPDCAISILVIILIHSILKSFSDSLENNNVSQIIYYVQYILIVTVIMTNFSDIIQMVKTTSENLVGFMNILVPLLITLMLYTGNIITSSVVEPIIFFMINILTSYNLFRRNDAWSRCRGRPSCGYGSPQLFRARCMPCQPLPRTRFCQSKSNDSL